MFIIAGISPKTTTLDHNPQRCPDCGLFQAHLKRTDSYFSLFFLPLFPVRRGQPYLWCERCERAFMEGDSPRPATPPQADVMLCRVCRRTLDPRFRYCPYCGSRQT